jgi:hypothetical protein
MYRKLGEPQGRSGRVWKMSPSPGFNPRTVQPVASRYTDLAIPAHSTYWIQNKIVVQALRFIYGIIVYSLPAEWRGGGGGGVGGGEGGAPIRVSAGGLWIKK